MSLSKEMAGKSTNQKKTRGRPKMEFVSQKPKIKRDKPGRPRKEIIIESQLEEIKSHKIPDTEKKKDGIILGMFIFSLILFTASLYFSQKKQEQVDDQIQTTETINEEPPMPEVENGVTSGEIGTGNETSIEQNESKETANTILLGEFYKAFNKGSIVDIYPNIDKKLLSSKLFKVYFSKMRVQRFLKNISSEGVTISNINETGETGGKINYTFSYTLRDGHYFEETREMQIVQQEIPKIGKIMCISTGCSKLPFFNPGKYF